jgi:hypothetical protein
MNNSIERRYSTRHWLALFAMLACPLALRAAGPSVAKPAATSAASAADEEQYAAVFLGGKKVGHMHLVRTVADGQVTTTNSMKMSLSRGPAAVGVTSVEKSVETLDGKPLSFKTVQLMGAMSTTVEGTLGEDGKLKVKTTAVGTVKEQEMDWPKDALMSEGLRLQSLAKGLKEGTSYTARMFDISSLRAMDANITIGPVVSVDLLGRVVKLSEVVAVLSSPMGKLTVTTYVDEKQDALKTITSILGMNMEILACNKEFALSPNDTATDFFDKILVASPSPLKNLKAARGFTYKVEPIGKAALEFPTTDEQTSAPGEGKTVLLTVRPIPLAKGEAFPYTGKDANLLGAMKPTKFLQSDDKRVAALAVQAVGDAKDSAEAAARIEKFVRKYISKKDLSVGYASAAEVVESRQGDCTEHAVLVAALCRASGIPAQVVMGIAYVPSFGNKKDVFGPHAWARAWVGGRWVSLDAALDGFDAGHITMGCGDGDPSDFFGVVNLLGNVKVIEAKANEPPPPPAAGYILE